MAECSRDRHRRELTLAKFVIWSSGPGLKRLKARKEKLLSEGRQSDESRETMANKLPYIALTVFPSRG